MGNGYMQEPLTVKLESLRLVLDSKTAMAATIKQAKDEIDRLTELDSRLFRVLCLAMKTVEEYRRRGWAHPNCDALFDQHAEVMKMISDYKNSGSLA